MLSAFGRRWRLLLGSFAAVLALSGAPVLLATDGSTQVASRSGDSVDQVTTGSIGGGAEIASAQGSAAFRAALKLVADGKHADAYEAARAIPSDLERRTLQWAAIYFGGGEVDYASVVRFMADAPDFADAPIFKTRLEQALVKADPDHASVIKVLGGEMPNTLEAPRPRRAPSSRGRPGSGSPRATPRDRSRAPRNSRRSALGRRSGRDPRAARWRRA
jgi:soluble lytic murein transglycosylase